MFTALIIIFLFVVAISAFFIMKHRLDSLADRHDLQTAIDQEVKKFTKSNEALSVAVYQSNRRYFKAVGQTIMGNGQRPNEHSVFQIGSVSKLFTGALLKLLVDDGLLRMDTTLDEVLGDQYPLSEAAKQVTLQQLITHTSGFPRVPKVFIDKAIGKVGKAHLLDDPYSHIDFEDVLNYLKTSEAKKKPGRFAYSNFGVGLLGHLLEKVSGKSLDQLARERIFTPLAMHETGIELSPKMQSALVQGYNKKGKATQLWRFGALAGAGAFHSTASDLLKFLESYLGENAPLPLSVESGWMKPGMLDQLFGNDTHYWHNGMVGGYASYVAVDPIKQIAVVVLSAKFVDPSMIGMMLMRQARTQSWAI